MLINSCRYDEGDGAPAAAAAAAAEGRGRSAEDEGIAEGYAYGVIDAVECSNGVRLVRMRDPWGVKKWTGAWSDGAPQWQARLSRGFRPITRFVFQFASSILSSILSRSNHDRGPTV